MAAGSLFLSLSLQPLIAAAGETWQAAFAAMPLDPNVQQLNRTNCVDIMLRAFGSNPVVKALVFMPGATDEFYMFRRAQADLTNARATLLDAVTALTNQTLIRATLRPPLLLLHTDEDLLEPSIQIKDLAIADKLRRAHFVPHALYNDRDWDFMEPILERSLKADISPWPHTSDSWHFYRHSFAAWNLNGGEALEAVALAGKTRFTVRRRMAIFRRAQVIFELDERVRARPKAQSFPR